MIVDKSFKNIYFLLVFLMLVCELNAFLNNETINYGNRKFNDEQHFTSMPRRNSRKLHEKSNRLFSFEPRDDNLELGIEFSVPFISIPIKKTFDSFSGYPGKIQGPLANINTGALTLTAIVVSAAIGTSYLWKLVDSFKPAIPQNVTSNNSSTSDNPANRTDRADNSMWYLAENIENILQKYNIDTIACSQRAVCLLVKNASENVSNGKGTSMEKILDGLTSINWLQTLIHGSAMADAIHSGHFDRSCEMKYARCKMKTRSLWNIVDRILKTLGS